MRCEARLVVAENQKRKNFTFSEGLEWARRLEQVEKLKARERSEANLKQSSEPENFPARKAQGDTRDRVAAIPSPPAALAHTRSDRRASSCGRGR